MSSKQGYTWYPKDWSNSDNVFELNLQERGLYREYIDRAMLDDNKVEYKPNLFARRWGCSVEELESVTTRLCALGLIVIKGEIISVPSCQKRIDIANKNRKNGAKGGRGKPKKNPDDNPKRTQTETQNESGGLTQDETQTVRQRESESESESERETNPRTGEELKRERITNAKSPRELIRTSEFADRIKALVSIHIKNGMKEHFLAQAENAILARKAYEKFYDKTPMIAKWFTEYIEDPNKFEEYKVSPSELAERKRARA